MGLSEKEELEMLELENENAILLRDANVAPAVNEEESGIAGQAWERATEPLPGLGGAVEAIRTDIPGAIAEGTGALAERLGPLGPTVARSGIAVAGGIGMAGEMLPKSALDIALIAAGGPIGRGVGKIGQKMLPQLEQRAPNVVKAVKAAMSANIIPTMTQILQSKPLAQAEEVVSRLPIIGKKIIAMREAQELAYQNLRTSAISSTGPKLAGSEIGDVTQREVFATLEAQRDAREKALAQLHGRMLGKSGAGVSREQVGKQLDEIIVERVEAARKTKNKLYDMVSEQIPPEADQLMASNLQAEAGRIIESVKNLPDEALSSKKLINDLRSGPAGKVIENAVDPVVLFNPSGGAMELGGKEMLERKAYTFKEMQTLREILNSKIQQRVISGDKKEAMIFRGLKDALDKDIVAFSETLPSGIKKKFDIATAYYRDVFKGKFETEEIIKLADLAKTDPENVYQMLVRPGDVSDIRRVKAVVGESGMAPLRRRFLEEATTATDGHLLSGPEITNNMAKYGTDTLKELLSPQQVNELTAYAKTRQMPRFVESAIEKRLRGIIQKSGNMFTAPEDVVSQIVNGDVATMRAVKRIVGPDGMKPYKRRIMEDILGEINNPNILPGQIQQKTSFGVRKALQSYDDNFLKEVFTKQELDEIEKIDNIRSLLESQPRLAQNAPNTAAAGASMLATAGAGALALHNAVTGAAVVIGADILSRLYVSESGRKLLLQGLDPRFAKNMPLYGKIIAAIANAKRDKADEERLNSGIKVK